MLDLEVIQVLRRHWLRKLITDERAGEALDILPELPLSRYSHHLFAGRIWDLRHGLTAYDACYVALSEYLDAPLVTCDARLARSTGHQATIELIS